MDATGEATWYDQYVVATEALHTIILTCAVVA